MTKGKAGILKYLDVHGEIRGPQKVNPLIIALYYCSVIFKYFQLRNNYCI